MATTPVVFIPALLCDEGLYRDVINRLGDAIEPHARFHVLPGCGHLSTLEKPTKSAALFATLLKNNVGAERG